MLLEAAEPEGGAPPGNAIYITQRKQEWSAAYDKENNNKYWIVRAARAKWEQSTIRHAALIRLQDQVTNERSRARQTAEELLQKPPADPIRAARIQMLMAPASKAEELVDGIQP